MRIFITMLFVSIFLNPFRSFSQHDREDSIFSEFSKCLSSYFKKEFKKNDTSYLFFYGNRFNVSMNLRSVDMDGERRFVNNYNDTLDSSYISDTSRKNFFYRGMSFKDFLNYILSQKTGSEVECILRKERGVRVFVDCPDEDWQHFYFDKVLYKKGWTITPVVDIFKSDGEKVQHNRFILLCSFTPQHGFSVRKKYRIHKNKNICSSNP